jgi:hypothetical protein
MMKNALLYATILAALWVAGGAAQAQTRTAEGPPQTETAHAPPPANNAPALAQNKTAPLLAQTKTFQVMFINHIDVQLNFSVDDVYACTANPGMVCYSTVAVGPHDFKAMQGSTVIRHTVATLYENADNPHWTICYIENGACD